MKAGRGVFINEKSHSKDMKWEGSYLLIALYSLMTRKEYKAISK